MMRDNIARNMLSG